MVTIVTAVRTLTNAPEKLRRRQNGTAQERKGAKGREITARWLSAAPEEAENNAGGLFGPPCPP